MISALSELRAAGAEVVPAGEVAERVGDQPALVELEPAQHVRAGAEHDVGARVDRDAREVAAVAAVLAERGLRPARDVLLVRALGARVQERDDDVGLARRAP